jgi:magnesium-transporting ATPase (P-type)
LVTALQDNGEIVAMTGDGVNDAPALKRADIGVAMGITGTAVSRQASDMVLTDDNFASIVSAVEEGRRVFDNLVKSLVFVLPTNIGEALVILVAVFFFPIVDGRPLMPILPVQILWVNLVATVALALPLAFEAMEPNVMQRPPRDPKKPILDAFVIWRTVYIAVLMTIGAIGLFQFEFRLGLEQGLGHEQAINEAQTAAVTTIIAFQICYLLTCRSLKRSVFSIGLFTNPTVFLGIGMIVLLQLAFVFIPFMGFLFSSSPLSLEAWARAFILGAVVWPVVAFEKYLRRTTASIGSKT